MEFVIKIQTGNEAMQTYFDVCEALVKVASGLSRKYGDEEVTPSIVPRPIFDTNGNTIGIWQVIEK